MAFDHVGQRKPFKSNEVTDGLWVRVVNNCRVPIYIEKMGKIDGDPGIIANDVITPIARYDIVGLPVKVNPVGMPEGYSSEIYTIVAVPSGQSVLLSFPRNHVSSEWGLHVRITLDAPGSGSSQLGPWTILDFSDSQIDVAHRTDTTSQDRPIHNYKNTLGPVGVSHEVGHAQESPSTNSVPVSRQIPVPRQSVP